jgi:predicted Mrr-cat superfamily restriction endonuclease
MNTPSKSCYLFRTSAELIERNVVGYGWDDFRFHEYQNAQEIIDRIGKRIGRSGNRIRRFKSIKAGDLIVVPLRSPSVVAIGKAVGKEIWDELAPLNRKNQHFIEFPKAPDGKALKIPRINFSEGLQRRLKMYSSIETLDAFGEEIHAAHTQAECGTVFNFRDCVIAKCATLETRAKKQLLDNLRWGRTGLLTGGEGLEILVKELLEIKPYENVRKMAKNAFRASYADADIEARLEGRDYLFQVKHHDGSTNDWGIRQLEAISESQRGSEFSSHNLVLVTSGDVSDETKSSAAAKGIKVIDGMELINWIWSSIPALNTKTQIALGISTVPQIVGHELFSS